MILKCCKCGDVTDWKDIKEWNEKDKFYCPNCVPAPKIVDITNNPKELRKLGFIVKG